MPIITTKPLCGDHLGRDVAWSSSWSNMFSGFDILNCLLWFREDFVKVRRLVISVNVRFSSLYEICWSVDTSCKLRFLNLRFQLKYKTIGYIFFYLVHIFFCCRTVTVKIYEGITCGSFILTGASVFALINSSIRRYLCGITQLKLNEAIVLVKKLNEAIVLIRPLRQNNSLNEAKQLAQRSDLQQTVNNSSVEATKLFFNTGL